MPRDKNGCLGCLVLSLPFLLYAGWGLHSWLLYARSGSWQPVRATIESAELIKHFDPDGGTEYSVKATYRYTFSGKTFTGHRVGVTVGSNAFHQRRFNELDAARKNGRPVTAFVNPKDPTEALLYREKESWLSLLVPLGFVFFGAGVLVIGMVAGGYRRGMDLANMPVQDASRVWNARTDWAAGRVRASMVRDMLIYWGGGLGLGLFAAILIVVVLKQDAPLFAKAIVGFYCPVPSLMLLKALALTLRQMVHGTPTLCLREVPVVPGRSVLGALRTHRTPRADRWHMRLHCYVPDTDNYSSADLKERVRQVTEQLESAGGQRSSCSVSDMRGRCAFSRDLQPVGDAKLDAEGHSMLPVSIEIPNGAPASSIALDFKVTWTLQVRARSFPLGFRAEFDLPVFYADENEITAFPTQPYGGAHG